MILFLKRLFFATCALGMIYVLLSLLMAMTIPEEVLYKMAEPTDYDYIIHPAIVFCGYGFYFIVLFFESILQKSSKPKKYTDPT